MKNKRKMKRIERKRKLEELIRYYNVAEAMKDCTDLLCNNYELKVCVLSVRVRKLLDKDLTPKERDKLMEIEREMRRLTKICINSSFLGSTDSREIKENYRNAKNKLYELGHVYSREIMKFLGKGKRPNFFKEDLKKTYDFQ